MMIVRTWRGSRVELTRAGLWPWLRGWITGGWTRIGRQFRAAAAADERRAALHHQPATGKAGSARQGGGARRRLRGDEDA